jgi:hypothetical protein
MKRDGKESLSLEYRLSRLYLYSRSFFFLSDYLMIKVKSRVNAREERNDLIKVEVYRV